MIPTTAAMQKVAVFCFHDDRLLVIHHPLAGTQVPAGTIEPGESPATAAARELEEETGLLVPGLRHVETFLRVRDDGVAHALEELRLKEFTVPRGHRVEVSQVDSGIAEFDYVTRDYGYEPPRTVSSKRGHTPVEKLTLRTERHLYSAELVDAPRESWLHEADGHRWRCSFEPLSEIQLFMTQHDWLLRVRAVVGPPTSTVPV